MTNKSDEMMEFLDSITEKYRGRSLSKSWQRGICVWCGGLATEFKDELSVREYGISGFCQKCQDEVFEELNEDD